MLHLLDARNVTDVDRSGMVLEADGATVADAVVGCGLLLRDFVHVVVVVAFAQYADRGRLD